VSLNLQRHLTDEEVQNIVDNISVSPIDLAHVEACAICRERLELLRIGQTRIDQLRHMQAPEAGPVCPGPESWWTVAMGEASAAEAERLLTHAATCANCGAALKETIADLRDDPTEEPMPAPLPEAIDRYAARLERAARPAPRPIRNWRRWAIPVGVAAAILLGVGYWMMAVPSVKSTNRLLARAFAENRTIDMRFPGADYSRLRQERSTATTEQSRPLLQANLDIANALANNQSDPDWLEARGRADLLRWDYQQALLAFQSAQGTRADNPALMADLATAFFERGEATGRGADYSTAAEWLSKAIQRDARNVEFRFNRAVVYERLHLYSRASEDWKEVLSREPGGGWAEEARRRLSEIEKNKRSGSELLTPRAYLQARYKDMDPELALRAVLESWIEVAGHEDSAEQAEAVEAIQSVAASLKERHQDPWLLDLSAGLAHPLGKRAFTALAQAVSANAGGRVSEAERLSGLAEAIFQTMGNAAGVQFAAVQQAYALQRAVRRSDCAAANERLSNLIPVNYAWLRTQVWTERGVCQYALGQLGPAWKDLATAVSIARNAGYRGAVFRPLAFQNSFRADLGDSDAAWAGNLAGLADVWSAPHEAISPFHFYSAMVELANRAGNSNTALAIKREAMDASAFVPNQSLAAMSHYRVATLALTAGQVALAFEEFQTAQALFQSLPAEKQYKTYVLDCELGRADAEFRTGAGLAARQRLDRLADGLGSIDDTYIRLRFYELLGRVCMRQGDQTRAVAALEMAHGIATKERSSLRDKRQQSVWANDNRALYHMLVESSLIAAAPDADIWAVWREYHGGAIPSNAAAVISFAILQDRTLIWTQAQDHVLMHVSSIGQDRLDTLVGRFRHACGDPAVPLAEVRALGRELYDLILAPVQDQLHGQVWIEPDGPLAGLPWEALVASSGQWAGEAARYSIFLEGVHASEDPLIDPRSRALIVAAAGESHDRGRTTQPLPGAAREAGAIAALFQDPVVLSGSDANLDRVRRALPGATIFHFAGHHGDSGLLLASDEGGTPAVLDGRDFALSASCRMAVLSACRTAGLGVGDEWNPDTLIHELQRAGVPAVVATRWSVDSERTADFMQRFYQTLLQGAAIDIALHDAAAFVRERPESAHPYYWAAFAFFKP